MRFISHFILFYHCEIALMFLHRLVKLSLPNYGDFELIFSQIQQFITICSKEQIQFAADKCTYPHSLRKSVIFYVAGYFGLMVFLTTITFSCPLVPLYNPVFGGPQTGETNHSKTSFGYGHYGKKFLSVVILSKTLLTVNMVSNF